MNTRFLLLILLIINTILVNAQDLPTIVPLSPNAASISKYGEIPVGYFTGIPNIGIPIYTVSSGELNLPLSLSYHGGGNKVESVASWVGLGWSLGSIPSISRNVRGIPDENNGYFSKFGGKTVEELWALRNQPSGGIYDSYRSSLYYGTADSEPDIFSYSLPSDSGKFFYNQEDDTFITYPKSNTIVEWDGTGFKLTTQDGVEYVFNITEKTTGSNPINTSWYASRILSASKNDTIRFTYQLENHITKTKNVAYKYHRLGGDTNGVPSNSGSILSTNSTNAIVVDSIIFDKGYVKFNRNSIIREDLNGGKSLKDVSVYNKHNQLISKHILTQRFKQGSGGGIGTACYNADSYSKKWMLLDKIEQVSSANSNEKLTHTFTYNESSFPDCRYSAGQDYWGYYNGNDQNANLTPPYFLPGVSTQIPGADRGVDPTKSPYGILTKITYPTGGYTEFDFENNMVDADELPPTYISEYQSLAGEEYFPAGSTIPTTSTFSKTFIINNPPDAILNNNNSNGGCTVDFTIGLPGCDLSGGANSCALFTVTTPSNNVHYIQIEGSSFYLPNGTYTMTASFDQFPTEYQDFYFIADWQKIDPNQGGNAYVGGLRIKEVRNYPSEYIQPLTKRYKYTESYDSTVSSGDIFSTPNFSHTENIVYITKDSQQFFTSLLLRVKSTSNIQQVTHSGSPVGYKTVFEETDNPNETGYTEYQFSNARDEPEHYGFPYPPERSVEHERGQLMESKIYKKSSNDFDEVQKQNLSYTTMPFETSTLYPKSSFAIKWGSLIIDETGDPSTNFASNMVEYSVYGGWNSIHTEFNLSHYDNESISTYTTNYYDNATHLLRTRTHTTDSRGDRMISVVKYPQDISSPSAVVTELINQNRLTETIETKTYKDLDNDAVADANELLSTQQTDYKVWFNSWDDVIEPEFIKTSKGSNTPENRIVYSYYTDGKVKEVSKADGTIITYIWGYNNTLPVAKVENATYNQLSSYVSNIQNKSNLDDDNCMDTSNCNEKDLRTAFTTLRNALPDALVTTYTYNPLIGVTSITDPKGYTIYYEYDGFNRLLSVKDASGHVLSENEYYYTTSNTSQP